MASSTPQGNGDKPSVFCVFCASSPGANPAHMASARALAHAMHENNIHLVYGGGTRGIMGEIARTLVSLSGPSAVHGIIPRALIRTEEGYEGTKVGDVGSGRAYGEKQEERVMSKVALDRVTSQDSNDNSRTATDPNILSITESEYGNTTIVPDMHTRKRLMASRVIAGGPGSGFVALAGGYGTLEEVAEMVTWNQLGIHGCGIVLVNIDGYWDGLVEWVKRSVKEEFVGLGNRDILVEVQKVEDVVEALKGYRVAEGRFKLDWGQE